MVLLSIFRPTPSALRARFIALLSCLAMLVINCSDFDQFTDMQIDPFSPEFGFPILNSEVTLEELLNAQEGQSLSYIEVTGDSLVIKYFQEVTFDPVLVLPGKAIHQNLPVLPYSFDVFYEDYFILGSASEMKQLHLKEGNITILFEKDFDEDVSVSLHFPGLIANDEAILIEANWTEGSNTSEHYIDLEGSILDLYRFENTDTLYNTITYEIELSSEGTASGLVDVYILMEPPAYSKIIGKIDYYGEVEQIDLEFDLFDSSFGDPYVYLENAFLEFGIGTSVGIPFSFLLDTLIFENYFGDTYFLANKEDPPPEGDNWVNFNIADKNYPDFADEEEPYVQTNFRLNNGNSNLDSLFAFLPNRLLFSGAYALGDFNPEYPVDSPHDFFVLDTSSVSLSTRLDMPLAGAIVDVTFEYPFEIDSWPDLDDDLIEDFEISIITKTRNNLPITFSLQVDFLDDDGNIIDSLFDNENLQHIIESPDVDEYGDPIGYRESFFVVGMTRDKFDKISASSQANMTYRIMSSGAIDKTVNLRPSHFIGMQLSVLAKPTLGG